MRILLVEDHARLAALIAKGLAAADLTVDQCARGDTALAAFGAVAYDAVILDLGLPDQDGLDVLRKLRKNGHAVPVLILTSRVQVTDRVRGLNAGADDYLVKPFAMEELVARLRALLRRPTASLGHILNVANLNFDCGAREAAVGDQALLLSRRETELLEHLLRRAGKVVPKEALESSLYGLDGDLSSNSVEVLVHRLRKKLSSAGAEVSVHTVRGVGYMLMAEPP